MRTLGVDLAAQPRKTAFCSIRWGEGRATVESLALGADDDRILSAAAEADAIRIDAPFGWPRPFVEFVRHHEAGSPDGQEWTVARRDALRFRRTDLVVAEVLGRWPLSVSSELIAVVAMRCAGLLAHLSVTDRSGDGRVFEVYPALALARWGFASRGYKSAKNTGSLTDLLNAVRNHCSWLTLDDEIAVQCAASDDLFDALIASLVARAGALGLTSRPDPADTELARSEGWIAVPAARSLPLLANAKAEGH